MKLQGDGSSGIHNPAYTDALLDALEAELGLEPEIAPTISPEELGIELHLQETSEAETEATAEVESGLAAPSIGLLVIAGLILSAAAYAFFLRGARS